MSNLDIVVTIVKILRAVNNLYQNAVSCGTISSQPCTWQINLPLSATHFDTAVPHTEVMCAQGQEQQFRLHPANSSTKFSAQHTPISHLWIAWTYSESLCCCAFIVTPIAVSGTEKDSGQNWAQTVGFRHFEVKRNMCSTKKTPKPVPTSWIGGRHKLPRNSGHDGGSYSLHLAMFGSLLPGSIFFELHLTKSSSKLRIILFYLLDRFVAGLHLLRSLKFSLGPKLLWAALNNITPFVLCFAL